MATRSYEYSKAIVLNAFSGSKRTKNVVMFHIGRSGSTVLGDLFNQNEHIFWDSEIFMRNRMPATLRPFNRPLFALPSLLIGTRRMRTIKPIYGYEAKLAHIRRLGRTLEQFLSDMKKLEFGHYIVLRRRNHLRSIISHLRAKQQGYWHQKAQGTAGFSGQSSAGVMLDVTSVAMGTDRSGKQLPLVEHIESVEIQFSHLNELLCGSPVLDLVYEDHIEQDPTVAYRKVCDFLDIAPAEVAVQLKKTNPWPIEDLVSNYDEVEKALTGSKYEWMLDS